MLYEALSKLPSGDLDVMQVSLEGQIADLRALWGDDLSPFQHGILDSMEQIDFRVRHRDKFRHSDESGRDKPYFLCRKCETAVLFATLDEVCCPQCNSIYWLELVFA